MSRMNFWQYSKVFPPILVRLLAKHGNRPLTTYEIAAVAKITPMKVEAISLSESWDDIDIPTALSFLRACKMDFCRKSDMHRARDYLRNPRWVYLRKSKQWKTYYEPLMIRYKNSTRTNA